MIEFQCSKCEKRLSVQDSAAGKYGDCPHCGQKLLIPEPEKVVLHAAEETDFSVPPIPNNPLQKAAEEKFHIFDISPKQIRQICKIILAIVIIVILFTIPAVSIVLGLGCLIVFALTFVPKWQWVPNRVLKLTEENNTSNRTRLVICSGLGVVLLFIGCSIALHKASIAKENQHVEEANHKVFELVNQGEAAMNQGNFELANQKLTDATHVADAKDFKPIKQFRLRLTKAQCQSFITTIKEAMEIGNISIAKQYIQSAKLIADTNDIWEIQGLENQIEIATNPTQMYNALMELSNAPLEQLDKNNKLPYRLTSGYKRLDEFATKLAKEQLPRVIAANEKIRQEQLERKRAFAEAARKAKEEKETQERVIAKAARKTEEERKAKTLFPYRVISAETFKQYKLSLDIRLLPTDGINPTEKQLEKLAKHLFNSYNGTQYERVFICYYLPSMVVNSGAWATTHFNPDLQIKILGNNWQGTSSEADAAKKVEGKRTSTEVAQKTIDRKNTSTRTDIGKWYLGGTLHKSSLLEWQRASYNNKLATCSDFVAAMWKNGNLNDSVSRRLNSVDDFRPFAHELVQFIDTALKGFDGNERNLANNTVSEFAAMGMVMMKWTKK